MIPGVGLLLRAFCGSLIFENVRNTWGCPQVHSCTTARVHTECSVWCQEVCGPLEFCLVSSRGSLSSGLRTGSHFWRGVLWRNQQPARIDMWSAGPLGECVRGARQPHLPRLWKRHCWLCSLSVNSSRRQMDFLPLSDPVWELRKNGCFSWVRKKCLSQRWIQSALLGGKHVLSVSKCTLPWWLLPGRKKNWSLGWKKRVWRRRKGDKWTEVKPGRGRMGGWALWAAARQRPSCKGLKLGRLQHQPWGRWGAAWNMPGSRKTRLTNGEDPWAPGDKPEPRFLDNEVELQKAESIPSKAAERGGPGETWKARLQTVYFIGKAPGALGALGQKALWKGWGEGTQGRAEAWGCDRADQLSGGGDKRFCGFHRDGTWGGLVVGIRTRSWWRRFCRSRGWGSLSLVKMGMLTSWVYWVWAIAGRACLSTSVKLKIKTFVVMVTCTCVFVSVVEMEEECLRYSYSLVKSLPFSGRVGLGTDVYPGGEACVSLHRPPSAEDCRRVFRSKPAYGPLDGSVVRILHTQWAFLFPTPGGQTSPPWALGTFPPSTQIALPINGIWTDFTGTTPDQSLLPHQSRGILSVERLCQIRKTNIPW